MAGRPEGKVGDIRVDVERGGGGVVAILGCGSCLNMGRSSVFLIV